MYARRRRTPACKRKVTGLSLIRALVLSPISRTCSLKRIEEGEVRRCPLELMYTGTPEDEVEP